MRIIGGEFRSRRLFSPPDDLTRPMPDRVKESLFSLLRGHCEDAAVFDAFAGSGSVGLEALSRGAREVVFVERRHEAADVLRSNVESLGAGDRCRVVVGDALGPGALAACPRPVHLVFVDPPYELMKTSVGRRRVFEQFGRLVSLLDDTGFAMLRTEWPFVSGAGEKAEEIPLAIEGARGPESHVYRHTAVHLYMRGDAPERRAAGGEGEAAS